MLLELYPRVHRRYTSVPVLGSTLDGYGTWLLKQGYSADRVREHLRTARRLARVLQRHGVRRLTDLTDAQFCVFRTILNTDWTKRATRAVGLCSARRGASVQRPQHLSLAHDRSSLWPGFTGELGIRGFQQRRLGYAESLSE